MSDVYNEAARVAYHRRMARHRELGLCIRCLRPAAPLSSRCFECLIAARRSHRKCKGYQEYRGRGCPPLFGRE